MTGRAERLTVLLVAVTLLLALLASAAGADEVTCDMLLEGDRQVLEFKVEGTGGSRGGIWGIRLEIVDYCYLGPFVGYYDGPPKWWGEVVTRYVFEAGTPKEGGRKDPIRQGKTKSFYLLSEDWGIFWYSGCWIYVAWETLDKEGNVRDSGTCGYVRPWE